MPETQTALRVGVESAGLRASLRSQLETRGQTTGSDPGSDPNSGETAFPKGARNDSLAPQQDPTARPSMFRHASSRRSVAAATTLAVAALLSACTTRSATMVGGARPRIPPRHPVGRNGRAHVCAHTTGAAYCWGYNANGQLGNNSTGMITSTPVRTVGGIAFASVSVSKVDDVTCGLSTSGVAYCWGENDKGQLGDGTTTRRLVPTPVASGLRFRDLAVGSDTHAP